MTRNSDNERAFYVVQFIELPFEGIDDYVCVPYTWVVLRKATNDKAVVAYPKDEDPFDTRDRAKRKERYNDEWRFYMASIKYESNSYNDAEFWLATRNDYGPLVEEKSKVTDTQPKFSINKKLRSANKNHSSESNDNFRKPLPRISIKRPKKSESKKEIDEKRLKLDESAQSSSAVVNDANVEPRSPKRKQSVIIQDNQSMESSHAEESSVASNADESTEPRSKTPRTDQTEQALSSPVKDVDKRTEVTNIDDEDHSHRVKKPDHNISMSQANSSSNTTNASMTATQPSTASKQSTQLNQYNHQECIPNRSSPSNFLPQIENVRSLANVDDHKLLVNEVSSQNLSSIYKGLVSHKISAHLYSHMNGGRRLVPIQKTVEKTKRPTKMARNLTIAAQNPSNSIAQTRHLSTSSVEQLPVGTQNQSQNKSQVLRTHTGNSRDQTVPLRSIGMISQEIHGPKINFETSNNLAAVDPWNVFQKVNYTAATSQQLQTRLPVTGSHLNVMDNACQTDECMVDETLSPYHSVTSDSDAVTDQEVISDHEIDTADKPTAAQSSTANSHQMNLKFILEQQMLDHFASLFTQMGSNLRHTTDMYNTLRSSILDIAEKYKKLLGAVEQFNTAGNAPNNASPSSNPIPDVPQPSEERHTTITASASSSNQDQHTNDVANKTPKKKHKKLFQFVLPPEYDAYDSRWTLKYRTYLAGLVELVPKSHVYVSYGDLKYCQQVSKDCPSLARRLLTEVFNRNALSICSSMSETEKASNSVGSNIRPDLDEHACSVLLNFVIEHGLQRSWNTDLKPILSMIDSKMQEIRFKYGVMVVC